MYKWLWITAVVAVFDQISKYLVTSQMELNEIVKIIPSLQFRYVRNEGAAFSLLSDAGGWQVWFFTSVGIAVSVMIILWLRHLTKNETWKAVALTLILGGALGNVIDRVRLTYVVDFIEVYYGNWSWPVFNIADSAVTVGVIIIAVEMVRELFAQRKANDTP